MEHDSVKPVHAYLSHWAALVEIERHPETAKAYHRAEYLAHITTSPDEARTRLVTASSIYRAALKPVGSA